MYPFRFIMLGLFLLYLCLFFLNSCSTTTSNNARAQNQATWADSLAGMSPEQIQKAAELRLKAEIHNQKMIQRKIHNIKMEARQGDAFAQYRLGNLYLNGLHVPGIHVPQDYFTAAKWYKKAVSQKHPIAMNNLAVLYARGDGVPKNYIKAYVLLKLSNAFGYDEARESFYNVKSFMTDEQIKKAEQYFSEEKK